MKKETIVAPNTTMDIQYLNSIYELRSFAISSAKIFIYGAGFYGYNLYQCCREQKIKVDGFIVSDYEKESNGDYFCELPVMPLSHSALNDRNFNVIVAVRQEIQEQILDVLERKLEKEQIKCVRDGAFLSEYMSRGVTRRINEVWGRIKRFYHPLPPSSYDKERAAYIKNSYSCIHMAVLDAYILGRFCLDYHAFFNTCMADNDTDTYYVMLLDYTRCSTIINPDIYARMKSSTNGRMDIIDGDNASFWLYYLRYHADDVVIEEPFYWVDAWALSWRKDYLYKGESSFFHYQPSIILEEYDKRNCRVQLEKLGIREPYICIFARDAAYKNESGDDTNQARNSDIDKFKIMTGYFYSRHIQSVRMGAVVNKSYSCEGAVDYATMGRTPLNDLYVFSKAECCVMDASGIAVIPMLFMKHTAATNVLLPVQSGELTFPFEIYLPILYYDNVNQKKLTLREVIKNYISVWKGKPEGNGVIEFTRHVWEMNLKMIYNTPEEIRDIAKEIYSIAKGKIVYTDEDKRLRDKFRQIIIDEIDEYPIIQFVGMPGRQWLRDNASWYLQ